MTSKATKDIISGKWGFKSSNAKSETELEKYKRENAALKKSMEEIIKGKSKMTDTERNRLLEKILALETEKEKYICRLGEKEKEIQSLKDKLKTRNKSSDVTSLLGQLEEKTKEAERREQLLNSLSEEMDRLKHNLSTVTARCSELENRASSFQLSQKAVMNCTASPSNLNEVEKQLKDALEKNQQWLVYDQQREAYVMGLLARIFELEQQSETINQQQAKEATAEGSLQEEKQKYYDQLLLMAKNDLDTERQTITQLRSELNEFKKKYEETKQEVMSLNSILQSQYNVATQTLEDEKKIKGDKIQRLKEENEITREKLKEEKKKTEDLLSQVQFLHKSLLKQQEEHTRIALLEQQIQMCTTDFENEKLDRQNLQHQLNKVLKELRKAREQITRLEPLKLQEFGRTEPSNGLQAAFEDMLTIKDKNPSLKRSNLLDESFLECPKCKVQYPTSQHRELLAHIDFCAD
ncbi:centrosomal protein of 55 kDa [Dermochelys coriacea]|uniref:centrosomal protein of 55 kDa n=1 Tax=Dermochelys coriacea TaxID=27794 RepID=UPI0018E8E1B5|nr:centrosomal protein of 55 kDa [Dermochelys coriacea]XP_038265178.1 centrosomal protein of 55 kDa [Dermochelys coriacea]XP_038265179.1 centrosomal protein of 55 kDa [Dermochelys coriacea]XP_043374647.1 centrosomal protein of 55 kDa [Dermochelys coriacea]